MKENKWWVTLVVSSQTKSRGLKSRGEKGQSSIDQALSWVEAYPGIIMPDSLEWSPVNSPPSTTVVQWRNAPIRRRRKTQTRCLIIVLICLRARARLRPVCFLCVKLWAREVCTGLSVKGRTRVVGVSNWIWRESMLLRDEKEKPPRVAFPKVGKFQVRVSLLTFLLWFPVCVKKKYI